MIELAPHDAAGPRLTISRLGALLLILALASGPSSIAVAQTPNTEGPGDVFNANPGGGDLYNNQTPQTNETPETPGEEPSEQTSGGDMIGRDECGGLIKNRLEYDRQFHTSAVIIPVEKERELDFKTQDGWAYRCGDCSRLGNKVICWPKPGYQDLMTAAPADEMPAPSPPLPPQGYCASPDSVAAAADAAAEAIVSGNPNAQVLDPLRAQQIALPPQVARPTDCLDTMVSAQSQRTSRPEAAIERARQAAECYHTFAATAPKLILEGCVTWNEPEANEAGGNDPAASNLAEANAVAGQIIQDLKLLFGAEQIERLSVPRSHAANIQSGVELAVEDYLAGAALGAVVARLTKGQVKNFLGGVGQKIMEKEFPDSVAQAVIKEVPGRRVDLLDPLTKTVREIKVGAPIVTSKSIQKQIAEDALLVQHGYTVEWWNLKNPLSGRQQFSDELIQTLQNAGIRPVSHI